MKWYKAVLLFVSLILISIPRFNWRPLPEPLNSFVGTKPFDVEQYEKYVEFFRGDKLILNELEGPFSYRPLVPFIASFLPFDALTSINLINLFFLSLGLFFLIKLLKHFNFDERAIFLGGLLYIISFPVFYYTTSGYIDASLVGMISIINYYMFLNKHFIFLIFFTLGILIKETVIIVLPVLVVYIYFQKNYEKKILKILFAVLIYAVVEGVIRYFAPSKNFYIWSPSTDILLFNLSRVKTYLSFILTFGLPGLISLIVFFSNKKNQIPNEVFYSLVSGIVMSILLWIYSILTAYADGRQLWVSYNFTVPLSMFYLTKFFNHKIKLK